MHNARARLQASKLLTAETQRQSDPFAEDTARNEDYAWDSNLTGMKPSRAPLEQVEPVMMAGRHQQIAIVLDRAVFDSKEGTQGQGTNALRKVVAWIILLVEHVRSAGLSTASSNLAHEQLAFVELYTRVIDTNSSPESIIGAGTSRPTSDRSRSVRAASLTTGEEESCNFELTEVSNLEKVLMQRLQEGLEQKEEGDSESSRSNLPMKSGDELAASLQARSHALASIASQVAKSLPWSTTTENRADSSGSKTQQSFGAAEASTATPSTLSTIVTALTPLGSGLRKTAQKCAVEPSGLHKVPSTAEGPSTSTTSKLGQLLHLPSPGRIPNLVLLLSPWFCGCLSECLTQKEAPSSRDNSNETPVCSASCPLFALLKTPRSNVALKNSLQSIITSASFIKQRNGAFFWCTPYVASKKQTASGDVDHHRALSNATEFITDFAFRRDLGLIHPLSPFEPTLGFCHLDRLDTLAAVAAVCESAGSSDSIISPEGALALVRLPLLSALLCNRHMFTRIAHDSVRTQTLHRKQWVEGILKQLHPNSRLARLVHGGQLSACSAGSSSSLDMDATDSKVITSRTGLVDDPFEDRKSVQNTPGSPGMRAKAWHPLSPLKLPGVSPQKPGLTSPLRMSLQSPTKSPVDARVGATPLSPNRLPGSSRRILFERPRNPFVANQQLLVTIASDMASPSFTDTSNVLYPDWLLKPRLYNEAFGLEVLAALRLSIDGPGGNTPAVCKPTHILGCLLARIRHFVWHAPEMKASDIVSRYRILSRALEVLREHGPDADNIQAPPHVRSCIATTTLQEPTGPDSCLINPSLVHKLLRFLPTGATRGASETHPVDILSGLDFGESLVGSISLAGCQILTMPLHFLMSELLHVLCSLQALCYVHSMLKSEERFSEKKWKDASAKALTLLIKFVRTEVIPVMESWELSSTSGTNHSSSTNVNGTDMLSHRERALYSMRFHLNLLFGDTLDPLFPNLACKIMSSITADPSTIFPSFPSSHQGGKAITRIRDPVAPKNLAAAAAAQGLLLIGIDPDSESTTSQDGKLTFMQWLVALLLTFYHHAGLPATVKQLALAESEVDWEVIFESTTTLEPLSPRPLEETKELLAGPSDIGQCVASPDDIVVEEGSVLQSLVRSLEESSQAKSNLSSETDKSKARKSKKIADRRAASTLKELLGSQASKSAGSLSLQDSDRAPTPRASSPVLSLAGSSASSGAKNPLLSVRSDISTALGTGLWKIYGFMKPSIARSSQHAYTGAGSDNPVREVSKSRLAHANTQINRNDTNSTARPQASEMDELMPAPSALDQAASDTSSLSRSSSAKYDNLSSPSKTTSARKVVVAATPQKEQAKQIRRQTPDAASTTQDEGQEEEDELGLSDIDIDALASPPPKSHRRPLIAATPSSPSSTRKSPRRVLAADSPAAESPSQIGSKRALERYFTSPKKKQISRGPSGSPQKAEPHSEPAESAPMVLVRRARPGASGMSNRFARLHSQMGAFLSGSQSESQNFIQRK